MTVIDQLPGTARACPGAPFAQRRAIRLGLLGVGTVGSAVARLALANPIEFGRPVRITAGLVRDARRPHAPNSVSLTTCGTDILDSAPDVVVEVLGGLEPARTLVLDALRRRIPVVTANKSLLAHHGNELLDAAAAEGVPLRYEAAVVAGVPFLGTFARRPLASRITSIFGIVNGTSNYVLSQMTDHGCDFGEAVARAQACGFAEPDPSKDVDGIDAAEKLAILVRQFLGVSISPTALDIKGIRQISRADLDDARARGAVIKPVVSAELSDGKLTAFVAPTRIAASHPLAALGGPANGVVLRSASGSEVTFTGPGAGPDVTAITILDDVFEALNERVAPGHARLDS
jgi:homoserine dehydrogenase